MSKAEWDAEKQAWIMPGKEKKKKEPKHVQGGSKKWHMPTNLSVPSGFRTEIILLGHFEKSECYKIFRYQEFVGRIERPPYLFEGQPAWGIYDRYGVCLEREDLPDKLWKYLIETLEDQVTENDVRWDSEKKKWMFPFSEEHRLRLLQNLDTQNGMVPVIGVSIEENGAECIWGQTNLAYKDICDTHEDDEFVFIRFGHMTKEAFGNLRDFDGY